MGGYHALKRLAIKLREARINSSLKEAKEVHYSEPLGIIETEMVFTKPLLCLLVFVLIAEASPVKRDYDGGRPTVGQLLIPLIHILQLGDNVTIHCPPEHPHLNWCHANNAQSGGVDKNRTPCVEEGDLDHECAVESHMLTIHNLTEVFNMTVWYCTTADCNNLTGVNGRIHLLRLANPQPMPSHTSSISKGPSCTPSTVTETATPCPRLTPTSCPPTETPNSQTGSSGTTSTSTVWTIVLLATFSLTTVTL